MRWTCHLAVALALCARTTSTALGADRIADIQNQAIQQGKSPVAHWGSDPNNYTQWGNHSNRLVPVYTFGTKDAGAGIDLDGYTGANSVYRDADRLQRLYGVLPKNTLNPNAQYLDQTDVYRIQKKALESGRKYLFLVIFDGMGWECSRAAAIAGGVEPYAEGRGQGLFFLDHDAGGTSQFGLMVTSAYADDVRVNVDSQSVSEVIPSGGYDPRQAGDTPWSSGSSLEYIKGILEQGSHCVTDSSSSATSMTAGIKTYNAGVGVTVEGRPVDTIAHRAQRKGYLVGTVTSVPISHATPAAGYAHNVHRNDYQDLSRDMLGLASIAHPTHPLPGLDLVMGTGLGNDRETDRDQGANFIPGNRYLSQKDLEAIDVAHGGKYRVCRREPNQDGGERLMAAAREAGQSNQRLLGFFGTRHDHLPYRTADGDFQPSLDRDKKSESNTKADLVENPTLAEMTQSALEYFRLRGQPFWLMVEPGDVDWAEHQDNLDNMIGAIYSGDEAVRAIVGWVEKNSNWQESLLIVTADHSHYFVLDDPSAIRGGGKP